MKVVGTHISLLELGVLSQSAEVLLQVGHLSVVNPGKPVDDPIYFHLISD